MYNTETEKMLYFKPGHEGSVKNGSIDPLGQYLATTGCDGHVNIYKIPLEGEDNQSVELIKKVKITKAKTQTFD